MSGDGERESAGDKTCAQEVNAPSAPGAMTEESAKSRRGDRSERIHHAPEGAHQGPRLSPDVPPYQRFREGSGGNTSKKKLKINTFEAGMYMKTNKTWTKCPEKVGHLRLSFGHFRLTDTNFAEIRGK